MTMKTKIFDCVQMKDRAQRELRVEYEARKAAFSSYVHFINSASEESEKEETPEEEVSELLGDAEREEGEEELII